VWFQGGVWRGEDGDKALVIYNGFKWSVSSWRATLADMKLVELGCEETIVDPDV
jgi:hypothetical protein